MKRVISKLLLVMGFLPFFLSSAEPEWIPPTLDVVTTYTITFIPHPIPLITTVNGSPVALGCPVLQNYISSILVYPLVDQSDCTLDNVIGNISFYRMVTTFCINSACDIGNGTRFDDMQIVETLETVKLCEDPNYQNGVDSDNLDGIDQCWPSSCPDSGLMWSNGNGVSSPTGAICVVNPISGMNCKYNAIENADGSKSDFTFVESGEGCSCGNELVPCQDLSDGEVTNFPQGQDGCVAMGDSVFCQADPNVECSNGVCNPGCGYIDQDFVCVESQIDPLVTAPCESSDLRPNCSGKNPGDCPEGVLNCGDPTAPDEPEAPCVAGDTRPECAGLSEGEIPEAGEGGATSDDISALGDLLRQGNENTKGIKDNTKKIANELTRKHSPEDLDPDNNSDWSDTKSAIASLTSSGDVNASESAFKNDFSSQEGFFNTQVLGLVPTGGSCQNLTLNFTHANVVIDACQYLVHAKIVIEWAMILAFLIYIRSAFSRLKPN